MAKNDIFTIVDTYKDLCKDACRTIWDHPEISGEEEFSSKYYAEILRKEGFRLVGDQRRRGIQLEVLR